MNTLDNLFIRACKSKDPHKRIETLYIRNYACPFEYKHIAIILERIARKYNLITVIDLMGELSPEKSYWYNDCPYDEKLVRILVNKIRHCAVDVLLNDGYRVPAVFRKCYPKQRL